MECLSDGCWEELQDKAAKGEVEGTMRSTRQLSARQLDQIPLRRGTIRRYLKFMRKQAMEADRTVIWCPRRGCEGAVQHRRWPQITKHAEWETLLESDWNVLQHEHSTATGVNGPREPPAVGRDGRGKLGVCETCKFSFCIDCKATWHGEYVNRTGSRPYSFQNFPISDSNPANNFPSNQFGFVLKVTIGGVSFGYSFGRVIQSCTDGRWYNRLGALSSLSFGL